MAEGFETLEGWFSLHDFRHFNWSSWGALQKVEKQDIQEELSELLSQYMHVEGKREGSFAFFYVVGQKADFLFLNLRPSLAELSVVEQKLNKTRFAKLTTPAYSYVSVVELSNYVVNHEKNPETEAMINARLYPMLPKTKHACFYPMNKRREGAENNWYLLPLEERKRLMKSHGLIGRQFAGQVIQMIGGSIGLDDWEWGVTLFAEDPLVFKHVVTQMRFDEVSARYADFGAFFVGNQLTLLQLKQILS
jgi:hydrogen peroxide-dependent heme synthase